MNSLIKKKQRVREREREERHEKKRKGNKERHVCAIDPRDRNAIRARTSDVSAAMGAGGGGGDGTRRRWGHSNAINCRHTLHSTRAKWEECKSGTTMARRRQSYTAIKWICMESRVSRALMLGYSSGGIIMNTFQKEYILSYFRCRVLRTWFRFPFLSLSNALRQWQWVANCYSDARRGELGIKKRGMVKD